MNEVAKAYWGASWLWGVPLIVVLVGFHTITLGGVRLLVGSMQRRLRRNRLVQMVHFALAPAITVLLATCLAAAEAAGWALVYVATGAMPDPRLAMLYSLSALTSFGHANIFLEPRWQMLGALESLNGILLFGLTTAFIFGVMERAWPFSEK
jgi:hypothetical protein